MARRFAVWFAVVGCLLAGSAFGQTLKTFYNFGPNDGAFSYAGLIQASDGNFYGTQSEGGANGAGVIFRITLSGSEEVFYTFGSQTNDGSYSVAPLYQATNGFLYGTTQGGGANGTGTIFKISLSGTLTTLYSFPARESGGGEQPSGRLIQGADGNFYGTTYEGGSAGLGTVFKMTPGGTVTILHSLGSDSDGNDGELCDAGLVQASDGNFYGVAVDGGTLGNGDIFVVSSSGGYSIPFNFSDGSQPAGDLVEGQEGVLFGTTQTGGNTEGGTAFSFTTGGSYLFLHAFTDAVDGQSPEGALFVASNGTLYGTTSSGGANGGGTLFSMSTGGTVDTLAALNSSGATSPYTPDGAFIQANDGNLYTTTNAGGTDGNGAVLQLKFSSAIAGPVTLTASPASISLGQQFKLSYAVSNAFSMTAQQCFATSATGAGAWNGVQTGTLSGGVYAGSANITPTDVGTYTYALTCGGQESGFATVTVTSALPATTTVLTATPSAPSIGQTVTLKATVAKKTGSGTPTGTVKFYYGTDLLSTGTLNGSGVATFSASTTGLPAGTYMLTADYGGDSGDQASQGNLNLMLSKNTTAVALMISPNPIPANGTATLTAKVTRADGTGIATGTVTYYYDTLELGTANLNGSGVATLQKSVAGVPANTYPIHAVYAGDASDNASTSTPVNAMVQ